MRSKNSLLAVFVCIAIACGIVSLANAEPPPHARGQFLSCLAKACAQEITATAPYIAGDLMSECGGLNVFDGIDCVHDMFIEDYTTLCVPAWTDDGFCSAALDAILCVDGAISQCLSAE